MNGVHCACVAAAVAALLAAGLAGCAADEVDDSEEQTAPAPTTQASAEHTPPKPKPPLVQINRLRDRSHPICGVGTSPTCE
jgi:hypothetical protein